MDTQPSLCRHPYMDDTVWYEVPCGVPIENPEPVGHDDTPDSWAGALEDVAYQRVYMGKMMMRAWCPVCQVWKEPLLAIDGEHYFGDELS